MKVCMRILVTVAMMLALAGASGCARQKSSPLFSYAPYSYASSSRESGDAQGSLFASDQAVLSNEDIDRILNSHITLPPKARIAVMKIGPRSRYWSEESPMLDQQTMASVLEALRKSDRIGTAASLPTILVPDKITVPYLREAGARYQADLLLVYRIGGGQYEKYRATRPDQVKAYCTVEAVLLDVRTGIVPYTTVAFKEVSGQRAPGDLSFDETTDKAYRDAEAQALLQVAEGLKAFLQSV